MRLQPSITSAQKIFQTSVKSFNQNRNYSNKIIPRRTNVLETCSKLATNLLAHPSTNSSNNIPTRFNIGAKGSSIQGLAPTYNVKINQVNPNISQEITFQPLTSTQMKTEINQLISRENRLLDNGVDLIFVHQCLSAFNALQKSDDIYPLLDKMATEGHKPYACVDVELGELLYGLSDSLNIIIEAHNYGICFEPSFLETHSGKKPGVIVGGHPSNFVVYFYPLLEAIALGNPACLLIHPSLPTAANHLIDLLEKNGVNFTGKLIRGSLGNPEDMKEIYSNSHDNGIHQGLFIGGLNLGEDVRRSAPNTFLELSGANVYAITKNEFQSNPEKTIENIIFNLLYAGGKQCTAPSQLICIGFDDTLLKTLQIKLQWASKSVKEVPAIDIKQFGLLLPHPIGGHPGNISQFEQAKKFVDGPIKIYQPNSPKPTEEVFGVPVALKIIDSIEDLNTTWGNHLLSMGISMPLDELPTFISYLKGLDPSTYSAIVNMGPQATSLAATPPVETFIPNPYTKSGIDVGMGTDSPSRFSSEKLSEKLVTSHSCEFSKLMQLSKPFTELLNLLNLSVEEFQAYSYSIRHSLAPTVTSRPVQKDEIKLTLEGFLENKTPLHIRLTNEDTQSIQKSMLLYILHAIDNKHKCIVSINPALTLDSEFKAVLDYDQKNKRLVSFRQETTDGFIHSLGTSISTVLCADETVKKEIINNNNSLSQLIPTNFAFNRMKFILGHKKSFKTIIPISDIGSISKRVHSIFESPFLEHTLGTPLLKENLNFQIQETEKYAKLYN